MFEQHWIEYHKAVCSIVFYGKSNVKLLSLTGFVYKDYIITDDQIYNQKNYRYVKITFYQEDGYKAFRKIEYDISELSSRLPDKKDMENLGFTYIRMAEEELNGTGRLEFCNNCQHNIGRSALTISYRWDLGSIGIKAAHISSNFLNDRGHAYLEFDGNIRMGMSGSPLIDFTSGKVLGIVANKEQQVIKSYREILKTTEQNLQVLMDVKERWTIEGVDPIQVLIINQKQIRHLSKEVFTNFAIKSGYALDSAVAKDFFDNLGEADHESEF